MSNVKIMKGLITKARELEAENGGEANIWFMCPPSPGEGGYTQRTTSLSLMRWLSETMIDLAEDDDNETV